MDILTVASQKGGAGKTPLSAHLAVEAAHGGYGAVVIVDTDPQGSLADWWNQRQADAPSFAAVELSCLSSYMAELRRQSVNFVVMDTPPRPAPDDPRHHPGCRSRAHPSPSEPARLARGGGGSRDS